jgi:hypothetical protein
MQIPCAWTFIGGTQMSWSVLAISQTPENSIVDGLQSKCSNYSRGKSIDYGLQNEKFWWRLLDINLRWNVIHGFEKTLERSYCFYRTLQIGNHQYNSKSQQIESLINTIDGIVWCDVKHFPLILLVKLKKILGYSAEEWLRKKLSFG